MKMDATCHGLQIVLYGPHERHQYATNRRMLDPTRLLKTQRTHFQADRYVHIVKQRLDGRPYEWSQPSPYHRCSPMLAMSSNREIMVLSKKTTQQRMERMEKKAKKTASRVQMTINFLMVIKLV